jgi:hypothetical protein
MQFCIPKKIVKILYNIWTMYVCKGWAIKLAPAPRPSMIYCATPTASPLLILHSGWNNTNIYLLKMKWNWWRSTCTAGDVVHTFRNSFTWRSTHWEKKNSVACVRSRKLYRPSDRRLSAKLVPTLADRGCCVVSATNPPKSLISVL